MKFTAYEHMERWEGLRLDAYLCPAKVWTIGYGHTRTAKPGMKITEADAKALLESDLGWATAAVNRLVRVPLNQNQFDALVSLVYNIGEGGFAGSTVLRRLNAGDYAGAARAFEMWNKITDSAGRKVVSRGLENRRASERLLFETSAGHITPAEDADRTVIPADALPVPKVTAGAKGGAAVIALAAAASELAGQYGIALPVGAIEVLIVGGLTQLASFVAGYMKPSREGDHP
jgi:lysozyme